MTWQVIEPPAAARLGWLLISCYLEGPGGRWVVDDLSFIEDKRSIVFSDADTYGIPLPADAVLVNIRVA